ncbi:MAG: hypothetical protein EOP11_16040 [Proteobacteria bacterium]|nr:MAG: hypothetical protein EOP11_16040 [Pseudomonadota bacterium]
MKNFLTLSLLAAAFAAAPAQAAMFGCAADTKDFKLDISGQAGDTVKASGSVSFKKSAGAVDITEAAFAEENLVQSWSDGENLNLQFRYELPEGTDAAGTVLVQINSKRKGADFAGEVSVFKNVNAPNLRRPVDVSYKGKVSCHMEIE